jgi:hypothetical protein
MNRKRIVIIAGLLTIMCSVLALAPLWLNPCVPTHLSEEEIKQFLEQYGSKHITSEEQAKNEQRYREAEIPCGAQGLPVYEKLEANRFHGMILDELEPMGKLILRFELVDTGKHGGTYYFKAYTFFYIPLYRVFAGGSGYMEIDMLPFTNNGVGIGEWK